MKPDLGALLQLASPALPVGGFSYSQGLEAAIESGLVHDAGSAGRWIRDGLLLGWARCEAPVCRLLMRAWGAHPFDTEALCHWNNWFMASRDSAEARLETRQMGWSMREWLLALDWGGSDWVERRHWLRALQAPPTLPLVAAAAWSAAGLDEDSALTGLAWSWLENQVNAAMKAVPLGQVAGQRLLLALRAELPRLVHSSLERADAIPPAPDTLLSGWGILSARHESQYSRLFRS